MAQSVKEAYCASMRNRIYTSSTDGQKAKAGVSRASLCFSSWTDAEVQLEFQDSQDTEAQSQTTITTTYYLFL